MYIPKHFNCDDKPRLFRFIKKYNFSTVITSLDNKPYVSHLPLILDEKNELLIGHLAKANLHWKELEGKEDVLCVFNGPHKYISPSWYKSPINVPTWNYAVVHVYGKINLINDADELNELLAFSVKKFEHDNGTSWDYAIPQAYKERLIDNIVGFHLKINRIEGKFKMNQSSRPEDRNNLLKEISSRGSENDLEVIKLIKEFNK